MQTDTGPDLRAQLDQCRASGQRLFTAHASAVNTLHGLHNAQKQANWQAYAEIQKKAEADLTRREAQLQQAQDKLEAEKALMLTPGLLGGDIIELNVGGEPMSTTRNTLTQAPDSMLAVMFSGRWENSFKHDRKGRIFLNYDPYCFGKVLGYLRSKAMQTPDSPPLKALVDEDHRAEFVTLLDHLGLAQYVRHAPPEEEVHRSRKRRAMHCSNFSQPRIPVYRPISPAASRPYDPTSPEYHPDHEEEQADDDEGDDYDYGYDPYYP